VEKFTEYSFLFLQDQQTVKWLFVLFVAIAVFILCLSLLILGARTSHPVTKRLYEITKTNLPTHSRGKLTTNIENVGSFVAPSENSSDRVDARQRLQYAGYGDNALPYYFGIKCILMLLLPGLTYLAILFFPTIESTTSMIAIVFSCAAGMIAPSFYLDHKVTQRQREIRHGMPDMLDLLIVCSEAGLGFEAGLDRVAKEIALNNLEISRELSIVGAEMRAGLDRQSSLRNLYLRTGVEEMRSLVSVLGQSARFGTSIVDALRVYAEDLKDKRLQDAEEQAAKLSITLLFPLACCFFPCIFIVILGPAMISVYKAFAHLG